MRAREINMVTWEQIKTNEDIAKLDGFNNSQKMRECFMEMYPKTEDSTPLKIIKWK